MYPRGVDKRFTFIGWPDVLDEVRSDHPGGFSFLILFKRPALSCGMLCGDILHPFQINEIIDVLIGINRIGCDQSGIKNTVHWSVTGGTL